MKAYKAFRTDLVCRGYQYDKGSVNVHDQKVANCVMNGFHCAENPFDCFTYYPDLKKSDYALVEAGGDIDEDNIDSKISCTRLSIIKVFTKEEFLIECLIYASRHGYRDRHISVDFAETTSCGYAICVGKNPQIKGKIGDYLAFGGLVNGVLRTCLVVKIDGVNFLPDTTYSLSELLLKSERRQAQEPDKPHTRCGDCELFDKKCRDYVDADEDFADSEKGFCPAYRPKVSADEQ